MADKIDIIKTELTDDTLGRGYAGMTDAQAAADINTVYRTRNKATMEAHEVIQQIVKTEFNALSAADTQLTWDLLHLGTLNPFGVEADLFTDAFGGGSTTIANLQSARVDNISRGDELGIGVVKIGNVQEARA